METFKYNNATIHIRGAIDEERLRKATVIFVRKADKCKRKKIKERNQNGNKNTTRVS